MNVYICIYIYIYIYIYICECVFVMKDMSLIVLSIPSPFYFSEWVDEPRYPANYVVMKDFL